MKVLIIEDERPAAEKLQLLLNRYDKSLEVLAVLESVKDSVAWLSENEADLIFMDIQLTDGVSFDIFKSLEIKTPVIFTTAYNEYALEAFDVNSIAYLLKPIKYDKLVSSLDKLKSLPNYLPSKQEQINLETLAAALTQVKKEYKNRFLVKMGEHIKSITSENTSCFYSEGRIVFLVNMENKKYFADQKMEELEAVLDPKMFHRVNRSFIVNINAIKDVIVYSKSRLKVVLHQDVEKEIIVSREKAKSFKDWFSGA